MKAPPIRFPHPVCLRFVPAPRRSALIALVALAQALVPPLPALEPGTVDPHFDPPASVAGPHPGIWRIGSFLYLGGATLRRVTDDGQLDAGWAPPPGDTGVYFSMAALPAGGYLAREPLGSVTVVRENGQVEAWRGLPAGGAGEPMFPQADGSVLLPAPGRVHSDGTVDNRYAKLGALVPAPFADGTGFLITGSMITTAVADSRGRLVVGGNFSQSGGASRLGLVRLGPDGTPDGGWNPGPALGVALTGEGWMKALPAGVARGPGDSIYVGLREQAVAGEPRFAMARVGEAGGVEAAWSWRWAPRSRVAVPIAVQADGMVLVGAHPVADGAAVGGSEAGVVRLHPDGSVDPGFSLRCEGGVTGVSAMVLDAAGWLWVSGDFTSVNGVPRPGLARVLAYTPASRAPEVEVAHVPGRVGTNEVLQLVASVAGFPEPALQWYRNGVAVPGATHPGLRVEIGDAGPPGEFRLVATNEAGRSERLFPEVVLATRSAVPGTRVAGWDRPLAPFPRVTQLVPLADGRVVVAGGPDESGTPGDVAVIGRLLADGTPDPAFAGVGYLRGDGPVEQVQVLADGRLLLAGRFSRLGGNPAAGLAELEPDGRLRPRAFPEADVPHFSAALAMSDGRLLVAGWFSRLDNRPLFRLARLRPDGSVDPDFVVSLEPWQMVDVLATDAAGRVLIGGERLLFEGVLTNPAPVGLQRLLPDGRRDPAFRVSPQSVRRVFIEPGGTLLAGYPYRRLGADGEPITSFEALPAGSWLGRFSEPDYRTDRLPDGGVVAGVRARPGGHELVRWDVEGWRNRAFRCPLSEQTSGPMVEALAVLDDGSVLVATRQLPRIGEELAPEVARRLIRIAPESDTRLTGVTVSGGRLRAVLGTQSGRKYQVLRRTAVGEGDSEPVADLEGDGYEQAVSTPAEGSQLFLELRRR